MPSAEHLPETHEHPCTLCRGQITCWNLPADCPSLCLNCVDDEALRAIQHAQQAADEASKALRSAVDAARALDVSWTRIGAELGTTRQAAQQRFSAAHL